jgi:peptidoglycan/xylan/chitin deacetylase (PgdA/CDA1 family)
MPGNEDDMSAFSLPIIMYHGIDAAERYHLNEQAFIRQMDHLAIAGFTTVLPDALNGAGSGYRNIMISFDDGYETDFSVAFPVLARYGFKAVSFVTTGFIGVRRGYLTWQQVRELKRAGFSIQSHTHRHRLLHLLADNELREELRHSKELIEDRLGTAVTALSMPGGSFSRRVGEIAREEGYEHLFTSLPGINGAGEFERRVFNRMLIGGRTSLGRFARIVRGDAAIYRQALRSYRMRYFVKRCIGFGTYQSLWRRFYKYRGTQREERA